MRPGTKMMMISSLAQKGNENRRRIGFEGERREMRYPENREGNDRREGGNGARGDYGAEGNYSQRNYGPQNAYDVEGGYRVRSRDDYERRDPPRNYGRTEGDMEPWRREAEREKGRRMEGEGRRRPMGHYGDEEDEDDMSGSFRHRKTPRKREEDYDDEKEVEFDELKAKKWVGQMQNGDGSIGEHYKVEQTEPLRMAHCPHCDKLQFWATMNMMYSDYCEVAKKLSIDRPEFYAYMAKAFLLDKDAGEEKLAKYMKYIAEK